MEAHAISHRWFPKMGLSLLTSFDVFGLRSATGRPPHESSKKKTALMQVSSSKQRPQCEPPGNTNNSEKQREWLKREWLKRSGHHSSWRAHVS